MKLKVKKILIFVIWIFAIAGTVVLLGFINKAQKQLTCKSVDIKLDTTNGVHFVTKEQISEVVNPAAGPVLGKAFGEIDLDAMEQKLNSVPWISDADVYSTISGELKVNVRQRIPLFRVYNIKGESYYIDTNGRAMPPSDHFASRVIVANGWITEPYISFRQIDVSKNDSVNKASMITQLFILTKFLDADPFWKIYFDQIVVNRDEDIILIPKSGNHLVVIGDISNLKKKLDNLMVFYQKGLKKMGWDYYRAINLKYENQIVCIKNM
jgi:cell division protein FtsQ